MTAILRLLTLILCLAPALALAQPKPDDVARTHYETGKQLAAAGKYAEAYAEFEAGYAAVPKPAFLFNMAEAARGMGDVAKARAAYERYLAAEPTGSIADTARKRLGEMPPKPPDPKPAVASTPVVTAPTPAEAAQQHETAVASRPMQPLPPQPEDKPIWKKWPFWAAVGGAVATTVVIVAVSSRGGGGPSCGAGCIDLR